MQRFYINDEPGKPMHPMTDEQMRHREDEVAKHIPPQPTEADRIADLEARLAAYENAYKEGVQNA